MSPHAILGVPANAGADEIRRRYRELAKVCHPDAGGDPADFIRLQQAYKTLLEEKSRPAAESKPAETPSWHEDFSMPAAEESPSESRPKWWEEISRESGGRAASLDEKKRNLYVERSLPDRSFGKLALATLASAVVVTLASLVKGGAPDFGACVGQIILFSTFLFMASAIGAAVGAGGDEEAFVKTYLGVLSLLAVALIVAVPLPFLKPA